VHKTNAGDRPAQASCVAPDRVAWIVARQPPAHRNCGMQRDTVWVMQASNIPEAKLRQLVEEHVEGRTLGIWAIEVFAAFIAELDLPRRLAEALPRTASNRSAKTRCFPFSRGRTGNRIREPGDVVKTLKSTA